MLCPEQHLFIFEIVEQGDMVTLEGSVWSLLLLYALQIKASFYGEVKERWILVARACVYRLGGAHTTHTNDAPNT